MVRVKEAHLTTPCMPTCSDQPSTSFHVQFAGQIDSKHSQSENLQVLVENGIRKRRGEELVSAPLHSIASISCDRYSSDESVDNGCHMVGLYFGNARRDEIRMTVVLLYVRNESDAHSLCSTMNELWMKSYSEYINSFLSLRSESGEPGPVNRKREFSVVSDDFGIASSGRESPAILPEDNTGEHVKKLMTVVGESLPKRKRAIFIQIMRKLSRGEESVLLAMLKLIELFGNKKDQVAEFECIVPQNDLDRFYQILGMHNISPLSVSIGKPSADLARNPSTRKESLHKRILQ
ncbi:hypothetical protein PRIPAC_78963 [Pristionchus pacificus]|uniref:Uncharacterized protein n=1 Tax=Pristionchus pacificus TaxID=54126 RepID=A0A2A6CNU5_PRIPA|nr:hypothetical protein PRIPAC_78963 [Pristionchus pacificus]|eukprot:PDM79872.1 hypothetical protein PRIPAC_32451 [Pristionchus pacificus]